MSTNRTIELEKTWETAKEKFRNDVGRAIIDGNMDMDENTARIMGYVEIMNNLMENAFDWMEDIERCCKKNDEILQELSGINTKLRQIECKHID